LKNKGPLLLALVILGCGLMAGDLFHLIKTRIQKKDNTSFSMKRDLFNFSQLMADMGGLGSKTGTAMPSVQPEASVATTDTVTPPPRVDIVFLGAIVRKNKRCALIALNGDMNVYEEGETLENGWRVDCIALSTLSVQTDQGDMMLAVEGDDHE